jgi:hypothetical protein
VKRGKEELDEMCETPHNLASSLMNKTLRQHATPVLKFFKN